MPDIIDDLRSKIESIDLDPIKFKIIDGNDGLGWSLDQANEADLMYRRFLYLIGKYPDISFVPTKIVDQIWHYHILDTEKYECDCFYIYGKMIHHFPYLGMRGGDDVDKLKSSFEETNYLFSKEFNCDPLSLEHFPSVEMSSGMCGGSGCNGHIHNSDHRRPRLSSPTAHVSLF